MELALNLLWLAVSAFLVVGWLRFRPRHLVMGVARGLMLVGCVILLLFPPISITDDLHCPFDAVEELSITARKAHSVAVAHLDFVVPGPAPAVRFDFIEAFCEHSASFQGFTGVTPAVSRAPPSA